MMSGDDNDGQMIFGDLGGLKLPNICLTGEEKPQKTSPRKPVSTGDRTGARCVTGTHAAAWPTAVDRASRVGQGADNEVLQKRISMATMAEKETFGMVLLVEEDPLDGM